MGDIEVLIVNDGSSDIKKNGGHGSTINTGVREAKGKYFKGC